MSFKFRVRVGNSNSNFFQVIRLKFNSKTRIFRIILFKFDSKTQFMGIFFSET